MKNKSKAQGQNHDDITVKPCKPWLRFSDTDKRGYWQKIFAGYEKSGLGARQFCRKHKIAISTFYYWHREMRLCRNNQPNIKVNPEILGNIDNYPFTEIKLPANILPMSEIEIRYNDLRITFRGEYNMDVLREVISLIDALPC